jgi:serine/threonine protein kinase
MLTKGGAIKLLDFGIAKNTNDDAADYTKTGLMQQMGTPMYMSPEQVKNTSEVTKETDIYSLGVVLWQMVTGKKPYDSDTLSLPEIQVAILKEPLPLTNSVWDEKIQSLTEKTIENRTVNLWFLFFNKRKVRQSEIKNEMVRNNSQFDQTKIDKASTDRNMNSSANSQKDKREKKGYFNLKTVSIGIGILLFIGILIIFNFSKHGNGDKSVKTIPENEKPEIVVPTETAEEPVLEKVEPITVEPKQLPKEKEQQEEVEKTTPIVSSSNLKIGQKYQGGIIFQLDNSGKHGKICAEKDLGQFNWDTAMEECLNLSLNEFNDWYLPSKTELNQLCIQQSEIGGFASGFYWSSSEYGIPGTAWYIYFYSGSISSDSKSDKYFARPVRSF